MRARFVHVGFFFPKRAKVVELEPVFTAFGDDWIRYSSLGWILWTAKPLPNISTLLQSHIAPEDQMLISTLGDEFFGFLAPWVWNWIRSKRPDLPFFDQDAAKAIARLPASLLNGLEDYEN